VRAATKTLALMAGAVVAVCVPLIVSPSPVLLWNTTSSAPVGLYLVRGAAELRAGELVAARPPGPWASWLDERGYLPRGVPLVKTVEAVPGQLICRLVGQVAVDGRFLVRARSEDRLGRSLPSWSGCRRLGADEVFLVNPSAPASLDGRYFGPSRADEVMGRLQPLWTRGG
jgi:conjugative transfer signal peptidase TraF